MKHGTANQYRYGCRCELCRTASSKARAKTRRNTQIGGMGGKEAFEAALDFFIDPVPMGEFLKAKYRDDSALAARVAAVKRKRL